MKRLLPAFLVLTYGCATITPVEERKSWTTIETPDDISGLAHTTCFADSDSIHIFSGIEDSHDSPLSNIGYSYNLTDKIWKRWATASGPSPVQNFASLKDKEDIYIFGGQYADQYSGSNLLFRYSLKDQNWTKISGVENVDPRWRPTMLKTRSKLFFYGGKTEKDQLNAAIYDLNKKQFKKLSTPLNLATRVAHVAAAYDEKVLIFGGSVGQNRKSDGFLYDSETDTWTEIVDSNLGYRLNAKTMLDKNKVYVVGGAVDFASQTFGSIYDFKSKEWKEIPKIAGVGELKGFETTLLPSEGILFWGGRSKDNAYNNAMYLFQFKSNSWVKLNIDNSPPGTMGGCMGTTTKGVVFAIGGIHIEGGKRLSHLKGLWILPTH